MIRNIINLKAIILYFGLILCLIAGMPTPAYGSSSYPVKEESYVLVINSYVDGERWSGNLLNMISKFATPEEYTLRIDHISVMLVDTPEKLKEKQEVFFEANKKKPDGIIYLGVNGWAFMRDKIREKWGDIPTLVCSETGEMAEDECYFNQRHYGISLRSSFSCGKQHQISSTHRKSCCQIDIISSMPFINEPCTRIWDSLPQSK